MVWVVVFGILGPLNAIGCGNAIARGNYGLAVFNGVAALLATAVVYFELCERYGS